MRRIAAIFLLLLWAFPAGATVNYATNKTVVLGDGITTTFSFSFIGVAAQYISVLYTTSAGVQTTLTQGAGTSQYTITLNSAVQGAIWGLGGTITYNPSGTPIPAGSTLTIFRTLPLTQAITLQNLASIAVLGKGAETGLDTGVMQGQQIAETNSRAIVANIANSAAPLPLPPAAQLANQGLCGDGTGLNIIACSIPSSGVISSAMQPVVAAATLALGRTAFGLGSMAVETINSGSCGGPSLQDDGSGNARVVEAMVSDSINQSVTCNFLLTQRLATGPITYTLPRANTLFAGWSFTIYDVTGAITITPNAADNFQGVASGGSVTVAAGSSCKVATNAASSGSWVLSCSTSVPTLSAGATGNALTLTLNGSLINFRDSTLALGDPVWAIPAGNLSITVPSGATLGTSSSNVPFRIWIFAAYNNGTPIMGVAKCSITTAIYPCAAWETLQKSGTAITTGSSSAGVLYTASGVSNDSVRIIGYADYGAGLGTAGTWASTPTTLQLCIPPFVCKKPGETIQTVYATATVSTSVGSSSKVQTNTTAQISPTTTSNLVEVMATGSLQDSWSTGASIAAQLSRGTGPTLFGSAVVNAANTGSNPGSVPTTLYGLDSPGSISGTTYSVYIWLPTGSAAGYWIGTQGSLATQSTIILKEIMGFLEPANDPLVMTG